MSFVDSGGAAVTFLDQGLSKAAINVAASGGRTADMGDRIWPGSVS